MDYNHPDSNLRDLKSVELDLLLEFDRVCKKLNLEYFLSSGTLLGAVRHSGFIPWDDDVDVMMFRKDYEKLLKLAPNEFAPQYFLQTQTTDMEFPFPFAKLRDSMTTLIEEQLSGLDINHGIYIDIFPLDGVPTNESLRKLGWIPISIIGYLSLSKTVRRDSPHKLAIIFKILNSIIHVKARTLLKIYTSLCRLCDAEKTKYVAFSSWPDYPFNRIIYKKSIFERTVMLRFHGHFFPAPSGYDDLLKQIYGDYMVLPPEEKRLSNHRYILIDANKPYQEYIGTEQSKAR